MLNKNKQLQGSKLKKRVGQKPKEEPLFQRIAVNSQRQVRALLAKILKLLLNGEIPESRVREARWLVRDCIEINRELSLRARLDAVCSFLKLDPQVDDAEENISLDDDGATADG